MAIEPVQIDFAARGVMETLRAFDRIEDRIVRMERAASGQARTSARQRVSTAQKEADDRVQIRRRGLSQEEKDAQRMRGSWLKEVKRAYKEEETEAKRSARAIARIEEGKERARVRAAEMSARLAARQAREEIRAHERVAQRLTAIGGKAMGTVGSLASMGAGMAGIGGGFLVADAVRRQLSDQKQAALLVNTVTTGATPPAGASVNAILAQAGQASKELGVDRGDLIGAALEYSRKARGGDFAGAMGNMAFFGKMSKVTGADINEIAGAAGILQSQNQSLDAPAMQQMLLDVYAQGKQGSMSMVDVAKQIGILGAPATNFAGNQGDVQRKLLGLGQLAAPQGTIEEAGTFIKDLVSEAASHRKSTRSKVGTEAMGVKFDKFGRMESPEQMIEAVMKYTKGDVTKIEDIFGKRGTPLFRSLLKPFTDAGGGAAGLEAVRKTMAGVTGATMTTGQLNAQNAVIDATDTQKFASAINSIEQTLMTGLAPAITRVATTLKDHEPEIEGFLRGLGDVTSWLIANPIKGIGALVLASVAKELASAGIGEGVKATLMAILGGARGGIVGGGGVLGTVGAVAGAGVAGVAAGVGIVDYLSAKELGRQRAVVGGSNATANDALALMAHTREGTMTPAELAKIQAEASTTKKEIDDRQRRAVISGHETSQDRGELRNLLKSFEMLTEAANRAQKKLDALKPPQGATGSGGDTPARNGPFPTRGDPRHV